MTNFGFHRLTLYISQPASKGATWATSSLFGGFRFILGSTQKTPAREGEGKIEFYLFNDLEKGRVHRFQFHLARAFDLFVPTLHIYIPRIESKGHLRGHKAHSIAFCARVRRLLVMLLFLG